MTLRTEDKFCDFVVFFLVGQYGNEQGDSYFSDRDYFLAHGCITAIRSWTNRPSGNYLAGYVVNHPVRYLQYYSLSHWIAWHRQERSSETVLPFTENGHFFSILYGTTGNHEVGGLVNSAVTVS